MLRTTRPWAGTGPEALAGCEGLGGALGLPGPVSAEGPGNAWGFPVGRPGVLLPCTPDPLTRHPATCLPVSEGGGGRLHTLTPWHAKLSRGQGLGPAAVR